MSATTRRFFAAYVPLAASLAWAAGSRAQPAPAPLTIESLAGIVRNMGYEPKVSSDGKTFSVIVNGAYDLTVTFSMSSPGSPVLAYIFLQRISLDELPRLNQTGLLMSNDTHFSYFSMQKFDDHYSLYIQRETLADAVTPLSMRNMLTNLAKATYETEALWNKDKWSPK